MSKSAQALVKDAGSNDLGAQAESAVEENHVKAVATDVKAVKFEEGTACTMSEAEIRQRLDAFAKELARAQRERSRH